MLSIATLCINNETTYTKLRINTPSYQQQGLLIIKSPLNKTIQDVSDYSGLNLSILLT